AFTDASTDKQGLIKVADQGTFFLDEIGDAPPTIQMKLLRFLEEKEIVPLGYTKPIKVDVRLVAATNKDLMEEVNKGRFREDLYYRLNVIPVVLPPLRQHKEDISTLANYFLKAVCEKENLGERKLLKSTIEHLKDYSWPGNIRELKHVVERAVILSDSFYIKPEHFGLPKAKKGKKLRELEETEIKRVLKDCNGNITQAAKMLGIDRKTLYNKLKEKSTKNKNNSNSIL
ncbi:sigma-54-dependent Fis family transcriptional regulator, partial [candidate division WOR-3 bacterium]|nr:sigma-54-dependent Fis family transcriptional regulator [candidate division WOR-3 bacterium]